jgi:hypothetical protein
MKLKQSTLFFIVISITSALLWTGCATGPGFAETEKSLPALDPSMGRIFFYRQRLSVSKNMFPQAVYLNNEQVGKADEGSFYYVDKPPGTYEVKVTTEVKRTLSFQLKAGETRYVRFKGSMGFVVGHVYPELVDPKEAMEEIKTCSLLPEEKRR